MYRRASYARPATLTGVLFGLIALIASCTDKGGEQDAELAALLGAALSRTYSGYLFVGFLFDFDASDGRTIGRYGFRHSGTPLVALSPSMETTSSQNGLSYLSRHPTLNRIYNRKGTPLVDLNYHQYSPATGSTTGDMSRGLGASSGQILIAPNGKYMLTQTGHFPTLYAYPLDPATGKINGPISGSQSLIGCTFAPRGVIHPGSAYAITPCANRVFVFTINPNTGAPTAATEYTGVGANDMAIQWNGNFAYTLNAGVPHINQFSMNPGTGTLTPLTPATVSFTGPPDISGENGARMVMHPTGNFLYVALAGKLSSFTVSTQTGLLTNLGTITLTETPFNTAAEFLSNWPVARHDIAFNETGEYMFVSSSHSASIAVFKVDTINGALNLVTDFETVLSTSSSTHHQAWSILYMKGL